MTYLEKYKQDHPDESIPPDCTPIDCPHRYGYEEAFNCSSIDCDDCWDREMSKEKETYSHEEVKEMLGINDKDVSKVMDIVEAKEKADEKMWIEYKAEHLAPIKEAINNYHNSIKDSGDRTQFATGAVRDMHEGKGRCDLLPFDIVYDLYKHNFGETDSTAETFYNLNKFTETGDVKYLHHISAALCKYIRVNGVHVINDCNSFESLSDMLLEVAKHFEDGAKKYGEYNWQKGIPVNCYIDSAVRHYLKYLRGDEDERHDRAFVWNILCCIWTCKHKPELNCYLKKESEGE